MRIRYSSFHALYHIKPLAKSCAVITTTADMLYLVSCVPVKLADLAYRRPDTWVTEADMEKEESSLVTG